MQESNQTVETVRTTPDKSVQDFIRMSIEVTRIEARQMSRKAGFDSEPYRGYGHDLKDGRFVFCMPDGMFYIRPLNP